MNDYRTGIGYDCHRLKTGIPLFIGGIKIPFSKGSEGHSDGDVLLHALVDALLGGAASGDIGSHFSDQDPKWRGVRSAIFMEHALKIIKKRKFSIRFVDGIVIAEKPKLQPYFEEIRFNLSELLQIPTSRISIKAKTAERLGNIGKGRAIAAFAAVTLASRKQD